MIASAFGVLFDGFAYGMLLFLLSVGLSVTLGMMNFVNLAHCSFAMLGGYVTVTLTNALGWPFLATLPLAFLAAAVVSVAFERVLYRRLHRATDLDQCLLTIGIVFISVAVAAYVYGTIQQPVNLPSYLRGTVTIMGQSFGVYRLFLIGMSLVVTVVLVAAVCQDRRGGHRVPVPDPAGRHRHRDRALHPRRHLDAGRPGHLAGSRIETKGLNLERLGTPDPLTPRTARPPITPWPGPTSGLAQNDPVTATYLGLPGDPEVTVSFD